MEAELMAELLKYSQRAYQKNFVAMTSGNISVRTPDQKGILIKASGTCLGDVGVEDYVFVDWQGNYEGEKKPSIEVNFHLGIYQKRPEVNAVIHLHSPYATALSLVSEEFPLKTITAKEIIGRVLTLPILKPGSLELAEHVINSFSQNKNDAVLILKGHGIVTIGKDLTEAFHRAELIEHEAKIVLMCR